MTRKLYLYEIFYKKNFILFLFNNTVLHYRQRERSLPHITCTSSATQCKPQKRTSPFYADFLSPYNTPADDQEHTQTRVFLICRAGRGDASLALPPRAFFASPASQSARIRRHTPRCGGRLVCRAIAHNTPQSVLASLWYFAGTPGWRGNNTSMSGDVRPLN